MSKAPKRLPPRLIMVGCDEQHETVVIEDQAVLRLIEEVINYIPLDCDKEREK